MPVCDGCGASVDDAHIRRRIERLEWATRFRPVHIAVLWIDRAPPARLEDYFYRPAADSSARSPAARAYFRAVMKTAGVAHDLRAAIDEQAALNEFQRRGFFLIGARECPIDDHPDAARAIERLGPTLLRRVEVSYKPKSIALFSPLTQPLVGIFQNSRWTDHLILDEGRPLAWDLVDEHGVPAVSGKAGR